MILDPHVHLRDWSQSYKETVYHAFNLASRLGIAGLIEMPNTDPPLISREAVEQRIKLVMAASQRLEAEGVRSPYYAMHMGLTAMPQQIREAVVLQRELFPQVAGLKLYAGHSTGNMGIVEPMSQQQVYGILAEENYTGVLVVHCEAQELVDHSRFNPQYPQSHSVARPVEAELRSIEQQLLLMEVTGFQGHLHVAHISTPEGVEMIEEARDAGNKVSCGATPQHCLLSLAWQEKLGIDGNLLKVNPPLRDETRRKRMWQLLLEGKLCWLESDHAPHAAHEKFSEKGMDIPSGIPGLTGIHLLYHRLKAEGLAENRLAALRYGNALEIYRLPWNKNDFSMEPLAVDIVAFREANGDVLYNGVDPYPGLCAQFAAHFITRS